MLWQGVLGFSVNLLGNRSAKVLYVLDEWKEDPIVSQLSANLARQPRMARDDRLIDQTRSTMMHPVLGWYSHQG